MYNNIYAVDMSVENIVKCVFGSEIILKSVVNLINAVLSNDINEIGNAFTAFFNPVVDECKRCVGIEE